MTDTYDFAIAGLGAMGSAAAYHLARKGASVLGLDRYAPPHTLGSSHGETRIIREAYFEHPSYVPIIQRAYELWEQLEEESGRKLFLQSGGVMVGPPDCALVTGAELSARTHHLPYERLTPAEVTERFPALTPAEGTVAIWDSRAGILFPEDCVRSHLDIARANGADLRFDEPVESWEADGEGVRVRTAKGEYRAGRLLLAAGAWIPGLANGLRLPLVVERQVLVWFEPDANPDYFSPDRCPIFLWDHGQDRHFYGFPNMGSGVKVALMHQGEETEVDTLDREVSQRDEDAVRAMLERYLPSANGPALSAQVCMFTNTPDTHFLIDFHPEAPQTLIASPCSGHGFKFASAIGEILAELLADGHSRLNIDLFRLDRFGAARA